MAAVNNITGDSISSRILSNNGRDNHDRIFAKKTPFYWMSLDQIDYSAWRDASTLTSIEITYREFLDKIAEQ